MKATEFLQAAMDVQNARAAEYDQPGGERSMGQTVQAFNAITGRDLTEAEGWLLLQVLKDVRQWKNPARFHQDSALDGVAYSSLKAEALAAAVKHDTPQPVPAVNRTGNPQLWKEGDRARYTSAPCSVFGPGAEIEIAEVRRDSFLLRNEAITQTLPFEFAANNFEWVGPKP